VHKTQKDEPEIHLRGTINGESLGLQTAPKVDESV